MILFDDLRRAAAEMLLLLRSPEPLVLAAMKIARLRVALIAATDQGDPDDLRRPSGAMLCPVCGDEYRDHPMVPAEPEPYLHHLCSGERVKL